MMTKDEILSKLNELKPFLYQDFAVKNIGIFGSYANNSNSEESDIDILIELKKQIGWKLFKLELYLEDIFKKKIDHI